MNVESRRRLTLAATVLGSSLAFIDASVVIVALPTIERDLGFGFAGEQWVFLSYSLALAALYLPAGAVGDRLGRREAFAAGIVGFALASALCGAAPDAAVLIVARTLQGVAGAFMTTNSLALLREVYGEESGRAVGLWTALTGVATVAGPPVGGAVVEWVSWRWIFFLNLPLAVLAVAAAVRGRCESRAQQRVGRLDAGGAVLTAVGFGSLAYGMVEGADSGFGGVWWAFAVAAAALAGFAWLERRLAEPMLPFELFRRRDFAFANLETLVVYGALGVMFFFLPIYLQFLGYSPLEAGLVNVPTSVVLIALSTRFGRLADRRGARLTLTIGPVLVGCGLLVLLGMGERSDLWTYGVAGLGIFSLGLAMIVAPITSTALAAAPTRYSGIASGVNQTVSRVGNLLAVAVAGLIVLLVFQAAGGEDAPFARGADGASVDAFRAALGLAAGLSFAGALVAALGLERARPETAPGRARNGRPT